MRPSSPEGEWARPTDEGVRRAAEEVVGRMRATKCIASKGDRTASPIEAIRFERLPPREGLAFESGAKREKLGERAGVPSSGPSSRRDRGGDVRCGVVREAKSREASRDAEWMRRGGGVGGISSAELGGESKCDGAVASGSESAAGSGAATASGEADEVGEAGDAES